MIGSPPKNVMGLSGLFSMFAPIVAMALALERNER